MIDAIVDAATKLGTTNFVMIMSSASIFYLTYALNKNTKANKSINVKFEKIVDLLDKINHTLKERLDMMFDLAKGKIMNVEETINLFYDIANSHAAEKIQFYRKILDENNLYERTDYIKHAMRVEIDRLTNKSVEKLVRYNSIIPDLYDLIYSTIDMCEIYEEAYKTTFNKSLSRAQKLKEHDSHMKRWFLEVEMAIRRKAEELGFK